MSHRGSILALPSGIHAWAVTSPAESPSGRSHPRLAEGDALDFLLSGRAATSPRSPTRPPALARGRHRPRRHADRRGGADLQRPRRREPQGRSGPDRGLARLSGGLRARLLRASRHCESLVREGDPDRFWATLFAPADRRPLYHALYAFNFEVAPDARFRARSRWPARSACNGGATPSRARREATSARTRWRRRSTTRSSASACRGRRSSTSSTLASSTSTTMRCRA